MSDALHQQRGALTQALPPIAADVSRLQGLIREREQEIRQKQEELVQYRRDIDADRAYASQINHALKLSK